MMRSSVPNGHIIASLEDYGKTEDAVAEMMVSEIRKLIRFERVETAEGPLVRGQIFCVVKDPQHERGLQELVSASL